jgi:hypothetical protein
MTTRAPLSATPWRPLRAKVWVLGLFWLWVAAALLAPTAGLVHGVLHHQPSAPREALSSAAPQTALAAPPATERVGHEAGTDECRLWDQLLGASPLRCAFNAPTVLPQAEQSRPGTWRAHHLARPYSPAQARGPPATA